MISNLEEDNQSDDRSEEEANTGDKRKLLVSDIKQKRKPNPIPVLQRHTDAEYLQKWNQYKSDITVTDFGCHEPRNAIWQGEYPYATKIGHTGANIQLSQLALKCEKQLLVQRGSHASHLCHNKRCINVDHIIVETQKKNMARNGCLAFVQCDCGKVVVACSHDPKCLRTALNLND
jgi:hypothetical protein